MRMEYSPLLYIPYSDTGNVSGSIFEYSAGSVDLHPGITMLVIDTEFKWGDSNEVMAIKSSMDG